MSGPDHSNDVVAVEEETGVRTASLVVIACVAAAFALYFGRELLVPIVFAVMLNALFRPVVRWLERCHLPTPLGAAAVVLSLVAAVAAAGILLAPVVQHWMHDAPQRFGAAEEKLIRLRQPVQQVAQKIEHVTNGSSTQPTHDVTPSPAPGFALRFLGGTTRLISAVVEVVLMLYLLLASGDLFVRKLIKVIPLWRDKRAAEDTVDRSQSVVMRYLLVTLLINLGQGVIVGLVMWWLKMPSPLLWGLGTVVLEFVPYLGATVIVALLTVIAFATYSDWLHIAAAPGSYLIITTLQNNVVSPYAYGQHLKLNPVAVLVGVLFWWFLWGTPGAFLAVPIVATIKIISDHVETLKPVGEFLGE